MLIITITIAILIAYLFGSISSAIIVCKMMGLPDPRTQGSRNPGASNVLRIGGKKAAVVTLLGDLLKGFIPTLIAIGYGLPPIGIALVALAAFLGHLFPLFFHFEGGKGVATALGCVLALSPFAGFLWIVTWLIVAFLSRYAALASLCASLLAPIYIWYFTQDLTYTLAMTLMSIIIFYRHHTNIANLLAGKETKIGQK